MIQDLPIKWGEFGLYFSNITEHALYRITGRLQGVSKIMFRNTVRILLVEDTAADATLVREALESGPWQAKITSAHSLEEARSSLKMSIPDLAIINRILPDGQGIELLPGDKESTAFPIVIMSSPGDERAEVATLKAGALDYVVKSAATLSDMPRIVERALREWGRIVEGLQAQEALIAANQRLSAEIANREKAEGERDLLFEHSIDMLAVAEIDGSFKQINPAWTKNLGWTEEELLGRPYLEFVHPDDHEATKAASAQILSARKLHGFENRYRCKDGTYRWVSWSSFALPDEGLTFAVARDITDRKRADEELRECDQRYHALFENNHASMLLIDPVTSAIVDANPAACSFYGYSKEELTQKKISDLNILPKEQIFQEMAKASSEQCCCFHFCHRLASGTVRDVEVYSGPITVHGKGLLYSIVHDVTERKQAEKALRESEERLGTLLDNLPGIGIVGRDETGDVIWVNKEMKELTGYDRELLVDFRQFLEVLQPDLEYRNWLVKTFEKVGANYRDLEIDIVCKDGEKRTLSFSNISAEISIPGFARWAMGIDITERKRTEEKLRAAHRQLQDIIEFLPDATFVIDRDKKVVAWNRAMAEKTGVGKEEIIGKGNKAYATALYGEPKPVLIDLIDVSDPDGAAAYDYVEKHGETLFAERFMPFLNGNKGGYAWIKASPLRDPKGSLVGAIESIRDITDRKQAEQELKAANRELDAFVYTVSHDLRTPLTTIIGYAEVLQGTCRERLDEQSFACLGEIVDAGMRMAALLQDLLAHATTRKAARPAEAVNTSDVVQQVVNDRAFQIADEGVEITVKSLPDLRIPRTFLAQIFDNLICNAVHYAGQEGNPIEIGGDRSGDQVRFYVRDHGSGISVEERNRVFDVFYRGTSGKRVPGTGVGLATVQKIAHLYGGRAWVEETPGGGSTFWVEVEVEDAPLAERRPVEPSYGLI